MPDLSSFTLGTSSIALGDFIVGYEAAAGSGSERRWTADDLTTGLLALAGATPAEVALLSGATSNIQAQIDAASGGLSTHEARTDNPHTVTAAQVGLGNVDNTSDLDKPVSTLTQAAIDAASGGLSTHEARTDNPHTVTAAQVGLGNVDNTSDLDKPVSTLTQAAIDAAGGGAFDADANTLITASTPIVLDQATDEAALTLDYTTNKASGNDTGLLINQTDTASPGTSSLMDLQVGGVSKFNVTANGAVGINATGTNKPTSLGIGSPATSLLGVWGGNRWCNAFGTDRMVLDSTSWLGFSSLAGSNDSFPAGSNVDVRLNRDAAGTLAQRNGINPQTFNLYNTYVGSGHYERAKIGWDADTFVIGTEAAGAGVVRDIQMRIGADRVFGVDTTLFNTSVGESALAGASLTGVRNNAMGYAALAANTTGSYNSAMGYAALATNTEGNSNNAMGYQALRATNTGSGNNAIGHNALFSNIDGNYNNAIGSSALASNTTGGYNSAMGYAALAANTTGNYNNAMGYQALVSNDTGGGNNAIGNNALFSDIDGHHNNAIGSSALFNNVSGSYSVALGSNALLNSTGSGNIGIGASSGSSITSGTYNLAAGYQTLLNANGSYNIALGWQSARYQADGTTALSVADNSIFIGRNSKGANSATNQIVIGDSAIGLGSNTTVLGSTATTQTQIFGGVVLPDLPTADPVNAGELWNDAGTLKISAG